MGLFMEKHMLKLGRNIIKFKNLVYLFRRSLEKLKVSFFVFKKLKMDIASSIGLCGL